MMSPACPLFIVVKMNNWLWPKSGQFLTVEASGGWRLEPGGKKDNNNNNNGSRSPEIIAQGGVGSDSPVLYPGLALTYYHQ